MVWNERLAELNYHANYNWLTRGEFRFTNWCKKQPSMKLFFLASALDIFSTYIFLKLSLASEANPVAARFVDLLGFEWFVVFGFLLLPLVFVFLWGCSKLIWWLNVRGYRKLGLTCIETEFEGRKRFVWSQFFVIGALRYACAVWNVSLSAFTFTKLVA